MPEDLDIRGQTQSFGKKVANFPQERKGLGKRDRIVAESEIEKRCRRRLSKPFEYFLLEYIAALVYTLRGCRPFELERALRHDDCMEFPEHFFTIT